MSWDELQMARKALHEANMRLAKYGISADPHMIIEAEEQRARVRQLEEALGIPCSAPPPPMEEDMFQQRQSERARGERQRDIEHQLNLLSIHRRNLAHYRAQAKAHGGVDFAPPMTRNGLAEQREGIVRVKAALRHLGGSYEDLPGDE